jgi:[ribosomal protein S5]-alanine N-acetyltransferase
MNDAKYIGLDVHQATISAAVHQSLSSFSGLSFRSVLPTLETSRLLLWPLELADAEEAQALFAHWEIARYLRKIVPWPYPPDGAYTWYRDHALPAMERGEEWHWTLRLKDSPDRLIGAIGLMREENDNRGFWLGLPWQGQGLMTEACEAVTDYWFDVLKFPVLRAPKAVPNVASRRISEKLGMRIIATEEREYVSGRFLAEIWEVTAEEWQTRRANAKV